MGIFTSIEIKEIYDVDFPNSLKSIKMKVNFI